MMGYNPLVRADCNALLLVYRNELLLLSHDASINVYLAPLRNFSKTLKKGAVCHHLYLTLTRFPFTVTCLNVLSA